MDNKVRWIEVDGKEVALRKSLGAYRVVYPFKRVPDGPILWKNVLFPGGLDNILKWTLILVMILLFYYVYDHDTSICRETMNNLGKTCTTYISLLNTNHSTQYADQQILNYILNLSNG